MSQFYGDVRQLGYVVPDIKAAMQHWVDALGVGPWFYLGEVAVDDAIVKGKTMSGSLKMALANSGDLQIELIEPVKGALPYHDFLCETGGVGGLQHLSSWPAPDQFEKIVAAHRTSGGRFLIEGEMSGTKFVYLDTQAHQGTLFELASPSDQSSRFFKRVRDASIDWDGSDPIVPLGAARAEYL